MVNTILKEADLFCPNSVRINFTIYHIAKGLSGLKPASEDYYS
ncbi:Aspartate aminotransferase [Lactiplantibacillus plantarum]|nr:ABC transporter ATP-binding protein [Lactiplantibacillus plantarum]KZT78000.1 Aspartate aminotransferase [Lactiplantibacillus plantarum]